MNTTPDAPDGVHLALRVDELAAGLAQLTADVEDLSSAFLPAEFALPPEDAPRSASSAAQEGSPSGEPLYACLDEWVEGFFEPTFPRPVGGEIRWCVQWQDHAEAVLRLEALWRSWEGLRLEPNLGIATWLTTYLDPIHTVLLARTGPFARCSPDRHA